MVRGWLRVLVKVEEWFSVFKWEFVYIFLMYFGFVYGIVVNLLGNFVVIVFWDYLCCVYDVYLEEEVVVFFGYLFGFYVVKFFLVKWDFVGIVSFD